MRKIIGAINMTLDGYCDHTAIDPDHEIHHHYSDLLNSADTILYGRITYQLMEDYWPALVSNPSGNKSLDEFAIAINSIHKIVFSNSLNRVNWETSSLAAGDLKSVVSSLKQQSGTDVLVGSRSIIIELLKHSLIDEFQLCIHPVIAGSGLPLFEKLTDRKTFKQTKTRSFRSGAVIHYYIPNTDVPR